MWVFGYGSLIWKVDFPYEEKLTGYVKGFKRRFYQHSTDHRGVPGKPGRVVTLIESSDNDLVWGIAYKLRTEDIEQVINHLDFREKQGYKRYTILFYPKSSAIEPFNITFYNSNVDNCNFIGEADLDSIAEQVCASVGPSGTNIEYVCNLAQSMREIAPGVDDEHLFSLEKKVMQRIQSNNIN